MGNMRKNKKDKTEISIFYVQGIFIVELLLHKNKLKVVQAVKAPD